MNRSVLITGASSGIGAATAEQLDGVVCYAVGADSKLVPIGKRLLPDLLGLRIIRSHFKI